jgi:hypothetical protein
MDAKDTTRLTLVAFAEEFDGGERPNFILFSQWPVGGGIGVNVGHNTLMKFVRGTVKL